MELTRTRIENSAEEYERREPLYAVENQHVEMLPETFRGEEYGWRDVEWVVQWYYRRYLGAYPVDERQAAENAFRDNDFEAVLDALAAVPDAELAGKLRRLTALDGVDVAVASAFLLFMYPERYVVVGDRVWGVLHEAGELDGPYPDPPSVEEYLSYDAVCQELFDRFDVDAWTLYRALWRIGKPQ